jgi:hypothetical protein
MLSLNEKQKHRMMHGSVKEKFLGDLLAVYELSAEYKRTMHCVPAILRETLLDFK